MVKTSHAVKYNNENTLPYYRKRGFKDRTNNYLWSACCYSPGQVHSEPRWACHDLKMCSTVDFPTVENDIIFSAYPSPKPSSRKLHKKRPVGERFQRETTRPSNKTCRNSDVLVERRCSKEKRLSLQSRKIKKYGLSKYRSF